MGIIRKDVYEIVTDRILDQLEKGVVPWHRSWKVKGVAPTNLVSKKEYRGINIWILAAMDYSSPYWVTYNQAKKLDGHVRKGEKGTPVVFWKWIKKDDPNKRPGEISSKGDGFPMLRYYTVFNVQQIDGIDDSKIPAEAEKESRDPIADCEMVVDGMPNPPEIKVVGGQPCYIPAADTVKIPDRGYFDTSEEYYSTMFHELVHATGHNSRLNRKGIAKTAAYGTERYSREELVAEMGAAFLSGHCNIENVTLENSAAYIDGWRKRISDDKKLVVNAAAAGHKAADYILDVQYEEN